MGFFRGCLERRTRAGTGLDLVGLWGDTGGGSRVGAEGWEFRDSKEIFLRWGRPKDTDQGSAEGPGDRAGVWKEQGVRPRAGERNCGAGPWECRAGDWWGQKDEDGRGQNPRDWEMLWE